VHCIWFQLHWFKVIVSSILQNLFAVLYRAVSGNELWCGVGAMISGIGESWFQLHWLKVIVLFILRILLAVQPMALSGCLLMNCRAGLVL
jgi:hypothetical protein